jgi:hypothetical protein
MVVAHVRSNNSPQMRFPEHDNMIQALPAQRSDYPLHVRTLPGTVRRNDQRLRPMQSGARQKQPEESIRLANSRPPVLSMKHGELLTERDVLECQFRRQPEGGQDPREQPQDGEYHGPGVSDPTRAKSILSIRPPFWRMTRHIVQQRLKQSRMRWSIQGAQALLNLRTRYRSGQFEQYWENKAAGW